MFSFITRWMHSSSTGSALLRVAHKFPRMRELVLTFMDNISVFTCRLKMGKVTFDPGKPTLLLCVHEASISGAPVLGLNLASKFSDEFNVVCMMLSGGALAENFASLCTATIAPRSGSVRDASPALLERVILTRVSQKFGLDAVLTNSVECAAVVRSASIARIPCLSLIHEFSEYSDPRRLTDTLALADKVVFSSEILARSARSSSGFDDSKLVILPQGRSDPPASSKGESYTAYLTRPIDAQEILCIGCGRVEMRKGPDLFISTAMAALRRNNKLRFVWIGDGYKPKSDIHYGFWLKDQILRSGHDNNIEIIPALSGPHLVDLFRDAGMMLLSSRLDPLPNVALDALHEGVPTVCFDRASGLVEYFQTDPVLKALVVPYLDTNAASETICNLVGDAERRSAVSERCVLLARSLFDMNDYVKKLNWHLADIRKGKVR
ncbi:glycosyltransferase [Rhizobium leguminosarum]|nr:glycosyltransferase [Rhizobium leguminosarum]